MGTVRVLFGACGSLCFVISHLNATLQPGSMRSSLPSLLLLICVYLLTSKSQKMLQFVVKEFYQAEMQGKRNQGWKLESSTWILRRHQELVKYWQLFNFAKLFFLDANFLCKTRFHLPVSHILQKANLSFRISINVPSVETPGPWLSSGNRLKEKDNVNVSNHCNQPRRWPWDVN